VEQLRHVNKIGLVGISFEKSARRESFEREVEKTVKSIKSLGIDVEKKIVVFQTDPPLNYEKNYKWKLKTIFTTSFVGARIFLNLELNSALNNPKAVMVAIARYLPRVVLNITKLFIRSLANPSSLWKEAQLSSKHVWAWRNFLNSQDLDLLIVLEDDAVSVGDLPMQLNTSIQSFTRSNRRPQYFDLGPHYEYSETYNLASLMLKIDSGVALAPFIANTTAAYAANRSFFETVLTDLKLNPTLENVSADWMVMELVRKGQMRGEVVEYRFIKGDPVYMNMSLISGDSALGNTP
jgi:hypothetical protein